MGMSAARFAGVMSLAFMALLPASCVVISRAKAQEQANVLPATYAEARDAKIRLLSTGPGFVESFDDLLFNPGVPGGVHGLGSHSDAGDSHHHDAFRGEPYPRRAAEGDKGCGVAKRGVRPCRGHEEQKGQKRGRGALYI